MGKGPQKQTKTWTLREQENHTRDVPAEILSTASSEKGGSNQGVLGGKTKVSEGSDLLWVAGQSLGGLQRSIWIVMVSAENRLHFLFLGSSQKTLDFLQLISSRGISNWLWFFLHRGWKKSFMLSHNLYGSHHSCCLAAHRSSTSHAGQAGFIVGSWCFLSTAHITFLEQGLGECML